MTMILDMSYELPVINDGIEAEVMRRLLTIQSLQPSSKSAFNKYLNDLVDTTREVIQELPEEMQQTYTNQLNAHITRIQKSFSQISNNTYPAYSTLDEEYI